MAKNDTGYSRARSSGGGSGGSSAGYRGRGVSRRTYLQNTTKEEEADLLVRTQIAGMVDALGDNVTSDQLVKIREGLVEEATDKTAEELLDAHVSSASDYHAMLNGQAKVQRIESAAVLIDALTSATRSTERADLDEGEWLDDLPSLTLQGSGWGDDLHRVSNYRKHVNIAVDNSGSTHMEASGYAAVALRGVAENLMKILGEAAKQWPGVTWDCFSFNRIAEQHTGYHGRQARAKLVSQQFSNLVVHDPLVRDAKKTNLAPLVEAMHLNEIDRNLQGQPRLDIILTDGEFESQKDANAAAEWQRQRGVGINTYVVNICPDLPSDVVLPQQFTVIPLECMDGGGLTYQSIKSVDEQVLRRALMRIVLAEVARANTN